jgi:hypothetical protein
LLFRAKDLFMAATPILPLPAGARGPRCIIGRTILTMLLHGLINFEGMLES